MAQPPFGSRRGDHPQKAEMQKKIEDLRKVKLLDVLDLQNQQVEKFFVVYNKYQKQLSDLRSQIEQQSIALQGAIGNDASEKDLSEKTASLRASIKEAEEAIENRFNEVQPILSTRQYAQYVVFEARFRDELQRMILDRMRRMRDR